MLIVFECVECVGYESFVVGFVGYVYSGFMKVMFCGVEFVLVMIVVVCIEVVYDFVCVYFGLFVYCYLFEVDKVGYKYGVVFVEWVVVLEDVDVVLLVCVLFGVGVFVIFDYGMVDVLGSC